MQDAGRADEEVNVIETQRGGHGAGILPDASRRASRCRAETEDPTQRAVRRHVGLRRKRRAGRREHELDHVAVEQLVVGRIAIAAPCRSPPSATRPARRCTVCRSAPARRRSRSTTGSASNPDSVKYLPRVAFAPMSLGLTRLHVYEAIAVAVQTRVVMSCRPGSGCRRGRSGRQPVRDPPSAVVHTEGGVPVIAFASGRRTGATR